MKATAHQPAYQPWLGLLHKLSQVDVFVSLDSVLSSHNSFENRNRILGPGGAQWLTVPVRRSIETPIMDVRVCQDQPWRRKHFRSLEQAYRKARGWEAYEPTLRALYAREWERLVDLNEATLDFMCREFGLDHVRRIKVSTYELTSRKSQLLVDACRAVGATSFLFGEMGEDYADTGAFERHGIEVRVQEYRATRYEQQQPGFTPNLSALDTLLNLGPKRAREVMVAGGQTRKVA